MKTVVKSAKANIFLMHFQLIVV